MWRFLSSFFPHPHPEPDPVLPPDKVAIIGAGMGGCFAAKFLRENGGKDLDIHVFAKKGSKVGGRAGVFHFNGHTYEKGVLFYNPDNKYLVDAVNKHNLTGNDLKYSPVGIFDKKSMYVFNSGLNHLRRYGFDILHLYNLVNSTMKKLSSIYHLQENEEAYSNVEDMLAAMGGQQMVDLMKVSAHEYMLDQLHFNEKLVNEFVAAITKLLISQSTSTVNALTAFRALSMVKRMIRVTGGVHKIAECVLEESNSSLIMEDVIGITRSEKDGAIQYAITTGDGRTDEGYNVVIIAHPLNTSPGINFENFTSDVYTHVATTPYQGVILTFCKGRINQEHFGGKPRNFPQGIINLDEAFDGILVPSDVQETGKHSTLPAQNPIKVWVVYSTKPLTEDLIQALFSEVDDMASCDWPAAYPRFDPLKYKSLSFVLDNGVFYINAIEMATSGMESSVIAAKNAALLAKKYLLHQQLE